MDKDSQKKRLLVLLALSAVGSSQMTAAEPASPSAESATVVKVVQQFFDAMQAETDWHRLRDVVSRLYPDCDELMERVVERTLFSFKSNKRIFNSVMALHRVEQWRRGMQRLGTRSRYPLTAEEVSRYDHVCSQAALDMLTHGDQAKCVRLDPTGREHLERAEQIRKRLQLLNRKRQLTPTLQESILARVVPELKAHVCC